ncbi:hypothetical protein BH23BAC1_BH23BAC1_25080 [soil metagenome]
MENKYIEKWIDAKGNTHYLDQAGNSYQPLSGAQAGMGSFLSNLFAPKEGGTVVGNLLSSTGTNFRWICYGGSGMPQQQVPYQQPVGVAPQPSPKNIYFNIRTGVADLAAAVLLSGKKRK